MLIISSIFISMLISAILTAIVDLNITEFLKTKNIDVETHRTGLLINLETDGKDKAEYDKCIKKIYIIFIVIFSLCFYFILPLI